MKNISILCLCILIVILGCAGNPDLKTIITKPTDYPGDYTILNEDYTFTLDYDFSKEFEINYSISSDITRYNNRETDREIESESKMNGFLTIQSLGTEKANLLYNDISVNLTAYEKVEASNGSVFMRPQSTYQKLDPSIYENYGNDGSLPNNQNAEYQLKISFPIINSEFTKGKMIDSEYNVPFNFYGATIILTGKITIEVIEFGLINDYKVAKLKLDFKVDDSNIPENIKKSAEYSFIGTGLYYFDIDRSVYIYGSSSTIENIKTEYIPASISGLNDTFIFGGDPKNITIENVTTYHKSND